MVRATALEIASSLAMTTSAKQPVYEPESLALLASPPHECSYLDDRQAVTLFVDPHIPLTPDIYSQLADLGFRRSGGYVYRPYCDSCQSCVAARVPVSHYKPNRSQRRNTALNADLDVTEVAAEYRDEQYQLYRRYLGMRHPGGAMTVDDPDQYLRFLTSDWSTTHFFEFREGEKLLAVAVVDLQKTGLSSVYTFFEPDERKRGLGVFAIQWLIEETQRRDLPYLYLGYWISECQKMRYKADYRPIELLRGHHWQSFGCKDEIPAESML